MAVLSVAWAFDRPALYGAYTVAYRMGVGANLFAIAAVALTGMIANKFAPTLAAHGKAQSAFEIIDCER
ncbi:hypothetical protein A7D25_10255 [Pseudomonas sp. 21C1]|nr:hypothetical protein A7D25_10255 [Pseudomonas sp. 21C1]